MQIVSLTLKISSFSPLFRNTDGFHSHALAIIMLLAPLFFQKSLIPLYVFATLSLLLLLPPFAIIGILANYFKEKNCSIVTIRLFRLLYSEILQLNMRKDSYLWYFLNIIKVHIVIRSFIFSSSMYRESTYTCLLNYLHVTYHKIINEWVR